MSNIQIPGDHIDCPNLIAGEWVSGLSEKVDVYSPYNGKVVGSFCKPSLDQIQTAIEASEKAYLSWSKTPLKERTQVMFNFREILLRDIDIIANTISLESGKTIGESKAGIMKGVEVLEFALSIQNLDSGAKMEVSRGVSCEYKRIPLGVVLSITPFNFPAMVPMWTLPISMTVGNCYIWKPSEKTPLTATLIGNAFIEAGLPKGVLTILNGESYEVNSIIENPKVKAVAFVGSSKVANIVYTKATSLGKRALCLGGAKNHIILLPDADPQMSGVGIADSFTGCAGQRCMAASVLLAVGNVDEQIANIKQRAQETTCGDKMGAIITKEQLSFLSDSIDQAVKDGATLLLDGREFKKPAGLEDGYWIAPTILDNVKPHHNAAKNELFGPILSIIRCNNLSQALEIENANDYGNACSVFTNNGGLAQIVADQANAAMIGVNIGVPVPREPFSFAGMNSSKFGHGEITGEQSVNFWTNLKKVTVKWQMQNDHNWMS